MLSDKYFYHRITRKLVVAFGTLFNNIRMVRYDKAGTTEIERVTVPLSYMAKEKFYQRLAQDPGLDRKVQISLPRMSFELVSITYDPLRTKSIFNSAYNANTNTTVRSAYTTPYNYAFQLNIYVRNTEDGTQIIEQILPYFTPDYTLTINFSDVVGEKIDIPIVLESIDYQDSRQVGGPDELRTLIWTLTFTVKAYLYGPVETRKLIRQVSANTFDSSVLQTTERKINLTGKTVNQTYNVTASGSSNYVIDGSNDPTLNLYRGSTYTFNVNATGHPFWIKTSPVTGTGDAYSDGVANNGTATGNITFVVPYDAPSTLYYACQVHSAMNGTFNITSASGDYKIGELAYQGVTPNSANASGFVKSWDNINNQIVLTDLSGVLVTGKSLTGAVTNTAYTISTFDVNDNQIINLTVTPNPSTANANDDFGFTETLEEYPDIT